MLSALFVAEVAEQHQSEKKLKQHIMFVVPLLFDSCVVLHSLRLHARGRDLVELTAVSKPLLHHTLCLTLMSYAHRGCALNSLRCCPVKTMCMVILVQGGRLYL